MTLKIELISIGLLWISSISMESLVVTLFLVFTESNLTDQLYLVITQ